MGVQHGGGPAVGKTDDAIAPVIPLFGHDTSRAGDGWRSTWDEDPQAGPTDPEAGGEWQLAESRLLKKLRSRSLSVSEARAALSASALDVESVDALLRGFLRHGYLDDAALAEQLVHAAVERRGQGRRVIAQVLARRGIPREVAEAALAQLPDDDRERALEFARSKAGPMARLDRDTALRRLSGQLSRRGYGSSVALTAARTALDELSEPTGVRFTEE